MKLLKLPYFDAMVKASMEWGVKYSFGAKFHPITVSPPSQKAVDCSGYSQFLIYHASGGQIVVPEGSQEQMHWCHGEGLTPVHYIYAARTASQDAFMCFRLETSQHAGHVWFVRYGMTIESYGGHGIGHRKADTEFFAGMCHLCFRVL